MGALTVPSSDIDATISRIGAAYTINDNVIRALSDSHAIATGIAQSNALNNYVVRPKVSAHLKSASNQVDT